MVVETKQFLPEEMLERLRQRAAAYDRENQFFQDDFDELVSVGYMKGPIPTEFGGLGLLLGDVCRAQQRLAYYAPATAIAVNMHLYWMGVAADLYRAGDNSCRWMLEDGAPGQIFPVGDSESGTDLAVL